MRIDIRPMWAVLALFVAVGLVTGCGGDGAAERMAAAKPGDMDDDGGNDGPSNGTDPTDSEPMDDPEPTDPEPTDPEPTDPEPTDPEPTDPEPTDPEPADPEPMDEPEGVATKLTGDWVMWGGNAHRNMVNASTGVSLDFDPDGRNLIWKKPAGSQAYANPVVADGRVFVGANNGSGYRPKYTNDGENEDLGVLLCFEEKTGDLQWQLSRTKLAAGRVNDWPEQGICSTPIVEGEHIYVVTNRAELMCVDVNGFSNGNDGFQDETDKEDLDADIIWSLDLIEDLGVFPHNLATSSPVIWEDSIFLVTSNGVGEEHLEVPAPRSPCFIAVDKKSGELLWEDNTPFDQILHGQWSSPTIGLVDGKPQVYFAGGDGWLYAFEPKGEDGEGRLIWKFDLNPKDSYWLLGGEGTRNAVIGTPVFVENSVVIAVGQDPEHGNGVGHLYRIDATKTGDVSPVLVVDESGEQIDQDVLFDKTKGHQIKPNPNSAQIWHYGGVDADGSVTGKKDREIFRRTISTAAVANGLVFIPDLTGYFHCVDFEKGTRHWEFDTFGEIWGSPMVVDGKVLLGDAEGDITIFEASSELKELNTITFPNSVYSTPTIANGNCYITDRNTLYAFSLTGTGATEETTTESDDAVEPEPTE